MAGVHRLDASASSIHEDPMGMVSHPVLEQRGQDRDRVLTLTGQGVPHPPSIRGVGNAPNRSFSDKTAELYRERTRGQPVVSTEDLAEGRVAQEGDVPEDL
jgi:hypothetical protein